MNRSWLWTVTLHLMLERLNEWNSLLLGFCHSFYVKQVQSTLFISRVPCTACVGNRSASWMWRICDSLWEGWMWYCRHSTWLLSLRISSKGFLMEPQNIWGVPQSNPTGKTCKNKVLKKYKISNPKLDVEIGRSMTSWETSQTEQINVSCKKSKNIDTFNCWILTFYISLPRIFEHIILNTTLEKRTTSHHTTCNSLK